MTCYFFRMAREDEDKDGTDPIYKVKLIPFQNRSVPIVLQNDNGPCPLIAISKFFSFFSGLVYCRGF